MRFSSSRLALAALALFPLAAYAEPLRWGYSPSDPAPYVSLEGNELSNCLTREIGEAVARVAGRQITFVATPNNRIDESLANNRVQVICNTLPEWLHSPDQVLWTQSLYQDEDVLITRRSEPPPGSVEALGKAIVGTTLGYHYSPELTRAFSQQLLVRHDVRDLPTRLRMLERGRLDAAIDLRRAVQYLLPENQQDFHISPWPVQTFALRCAIAQPDESASQQLARTIDQMIEQGRILRIVEGFD
ncbi:MAG: transporter substrate-binding domain-containing protein [Halopseudomonas sp.]|uniref:substrate-binding periplasmic protein n=1 Tax=Halopseudomonas sp. TaxID=2901191 RepID=UPI0030034B42